MTFKRRNGGRNKKGRGHVNYIYCSNCGRTCPKDKAVKRFQARNIVDASSRRDVEEMSVYEKYELPKLYIKMQYCISCAVHARVVRVRKAEFRRVRENPTRFRRRQPREGGREGGREGREGRDEKKAAPAGAPAAAAAKTA